jgi:hypothetical protein
MENEKPLPLPLSGDEVRAGIMAKIEESLSKSCHLKFDNAYTKVKAKIRIELELDDYGRAVVDNHEVAVTQEVEGLEPTDMRQAEANITMEPVPPNVFRTSTGQAVPVAVKSGKKTEIKHVQYSPRKVAP